MFKILARLKFFRTSRNVHVKAEPFDTPAAAVAVMDRFLDGEPRYPLEWDDFISWENENETIEAARLRLCEAEPLLFSSKPDDRKKYEAVIRNQRNRLAALVGIPVRGGEEAE